MHVCATVGRDEGIFEAVRLFSIVGDGLHDELIQLNLAKPLIHCLAPFRCSLSLGQAQKVLELEGEVADVVDSIGL